MEEEKISKQKPHTSFNRRLSIAKNLEGNMTTAKKNIKNFILQGNMTKGEYGKGYYGNCFKINKKHNLLLILNSFIRIHVLFWKSFLISNYLILLMAQLKN